MDALEVYLEARRREVDQALERFLPSPSTCPPIVVEAMRYSVTAGGKRLRPILTLASAEAIADYHDDPVDRARELALPAACAIEMIHTYSLIHDDLPAMDDDALRRGRPTSHVVFGEGMAILAGDGLHAEAFGLLAREPASNDPVIRARKLEVIALIASAAGAAGMVGGQAIDLEAVRPTPGRAQPPPFDAERLSEMHSRKTGALIRASAMAGAVMAGASSGERIVIDVFAREIGLAFQIVDDILDVEGAAPQLGKTAGKDAAAGKPTYPALHGIERSRALADECRARALHVLDAARLRHSRLPELADWVIRRQS